MDALSQRIAAVCEVLAPLPGTGWLVGGGLRDLILDRTVTDVDVAFDGDARAAARALAAGHSAGCYELSPSFGAWRVQGGDLTFTIDLTPLQGASITEDLLRRDLTVNALALPIGASCPEGLLDVTGGLDDLAAGRVRMVSSTAFSSDSVRLLRLVRQTTQLGFRIDELTIDQARRDATRLWESAGERVFDEVVRMISTPHPVDALHLCDQLGLLEVLCGAPVDVGDTAVNSRLVRTDVLWALLRKLGESFPDDTESIEGLLDAPLADGVDRRGALILATLWDGSPEGRSGVEAWCRRLRTSVRLRDHLVHIVAGASLPRDVGEAWSPSRRYRFLSAVAPVAVEVVLLGVAGAPASERDRTIAWARGILATLTGLEGRAGEPPVIAGDQLAREMGLTPGPWLREALERVREAQMMEGLSTPNEAIALVRTFLRKVRTDPE